METVQIPGRLLTKITNEQNYVLDSKCHFDENFQLTAQALYLVRNIKWLILFVRGFLKFLFGVGSC